jgi:hypothetical protein
MFGGSYMAAKGSRDAALAREVLANMNSLQRF